MIDFDFKTGKKDIQLFSRIVPVVLIIWGVVFGVFIQEPRWSGQAHYWFFAVAIILLFWGMVSPYTLKPIYVGWMYFTRCVAWVLTTVVLGLVFYVGFTVIGFLMRLFGKDPLNRKIDKNAASYWNKRTLGPPDKAHYGKQF